MKKAVVANCKKLSLRKHPDDIPYLSEEIEADVPCGTVVEVDLDDCTYNWQGRLYYKVKLTNGKTGYAPEGSLVFKEA